MTDKQRYIIILNKANELMRDPGNQPKADFLINKRLFNNAFAALVKTGVPASLSEDGSSVTIFLEGREFTSMTKSIEQVLMGDYRDSMDTCLAMKPIYDCSEKTASESLYGEDYKSIDISDFDFDLPQPDHQTTVPISTVSDSLRPQDAEAFPKVITKAKSISRPEDAASETNLFQRISAPQNTLYEIAADAEETASFSDDLPDGDLEEPDINPSVLNRPIAFRSFDFNDTSRLEQSIDDEFGSEGFSDSSEQNSGNVIRLIRPSISDKLPQPDPQPKNSKEDREEPNAPKNQASFSTAKLRLVEPSQKEDFHLNSVRGAASVDSRSSLSQNELGGSPDIDISKSGFKPKNQRFEAESASDKVTKDPHVKEKRSGGLFSLFRKKPQDASASSGRASESVPENIAPKGASADFSFVPNKAFQNSHVQSSPKKEDLITEPKLTAEIKPKADYSHDGGELFQHIKNIALKKKFGNDMIGPFRFIFWPTALPMTSDQTFAEMIVYVVDSLNHFESTYICDRNTPEIRITLGTMDFKVYGLWEAGKFESHVSITGKTASIFEVQEKTEMLLPQEINEFYFEQFRFEKKGQPKLMIVPFKAQNRGEINIPITGYVELNGKKIPLQRMSGNTLKYKYNGRIITIFGHFEHNRFTFLAE